MEKETRRKNLVFLIFEMHKAMLVLNENSSGKEGSYYFPYSIELEMLNSIRKWEIELESLIEEEIKS